MQLWTVVCFALACSVVSVSSSKVSYDDSAQRINLANEAKRISQIISRVRETIQSPDLAHEKNVHDHVRTLEHSIEELNEISTDLGILEDINEILVNYSTTTFEILLANKTVKECAEGLREWSLKYIPNTVEGKPHFKEDARKYMIRNRRFIFENLVSRLKSGLDMEEAFVMLAEDVTEWIFPDETKVDQSEEVN
ncbi:hypothetical protein PSACC_00664 [Paramicrosporidium saccamoebae]|uniref:Uncharacterized protein n=1 Tax=Paramicrosporidium saccamoebae TaxID=1246581 RepID=A0A2H9TPD1_9FUNG|nr:hypothetical protein PSACC_00664 [Paramicrosporidium saccamoebae]